jgi:hypothetical protein
MEQIVNSLFQSWINSAQESPDAKTHFHRLRMTLEPIIFNYFIEKYLPTLKVWWQNYNLPLVSDRAIVIYETRTLPHLEFHILNTCYFAKGWSLIIYCTRQNIDEIIRILGPNHHRATLRLVEPGDKPRDTYISFYKSRQLWESIPATYALCAEIDSYLRKPIPETIRDYDFVCARWPWHPDSPGGSGLTIRRVSAMLRICDELPGLTDEIPDLDSWAAHGIKRLGLKYNNTMFMEAEPLEDPVGLHQWWTFMRPPSLHILRYLVLEITDGGS